MKFLILVIGLILLPLNANAQVGQCQQPDTFEKLIQDAASYARGSETQDQTIRWLLFEKNEKLKTMNSIFERELHVSFRELFDLYISHFRAIDQAYQAEVVAKNFEDYPEDLEAAWKYHFYVLDSVLPVLLRERLFNQFRRSGITPELEAKGAALWSAMRAKDFSKANMIACRDQGYEKPIVDVATVIPEIREIISAESEEQVVVPSPYDEASLQIFNPDFELEVKQAEEFGSNPDEEAVPEESSNPGNIWSSIKNFFTGVGNTKTDEDENPFIFDGEIGSERINSTNLPVILDYFDGKQTNIELKERYTDWRNYRNYWVHKTNYISGHNLDNLQGRFKLAFDKLLNINCRYKQGECTNEEVQTDRKWGALRSVEVVCQEQRLNADCWTTGNTAPDHIEIDWDEYPELTK